MYVKHLFFCSGVCWSAWVQLIHAGLCSSWLQICLWVCHLSWMSSKLRANGNTQGSFGLRLKTYSRSLSFSQILSVKVSHTVNPSIEGTGKYMLPMEELVVSRESISAEWRLRLPQATWGLKAILTTSQCASLSVLLVLTELGHWLPNGAQGLWVMLTLSCTVIIVCKGFPSPHYSSPFHHSPQIPGLQALLPYFFGLKLIRFHFLL